MRYILVACQLLSIIILWRRFRAATYSTFGFLFLVVAFVYHGLSEISGGLFGESPYAWIVSAKGANIWLIYVTIAMILFSAVYSRCYRLAPGAMKLRATQAAHISSMSTWVSKLQYVFCIGLLGFCVIFVLRKDSYFFSGIVDQFYILLLVSVSAMTNLYTKNKAPVIVLLLSLMAALTLSDSRGLVVLTLLCNVMFALKSGFRPSRRQLAISSAGFLVIYIAVTNARAVYGRENLMGISFVERIGLLFASKSGYASASRQEGFSELSGRIDGNSFGAAIFDALNEKDFPYAGLSPIIALTKLSIPNFVYSSKHLNASELEDETVIVLAYGLPVEVDYLPTLFGTFYSYYGLISLAICTIIFAFGAAKIEIWVDKNYGPKGILVFASMLICAVFLEQGMRIIFTLCRGTFLIVAAFWMIEKYVDTGGRRRNAAHQTKWNPITAQKQ